MTNHHESEDARTPAEVLQAFTTSFVDGMQEVLDQLAYLTAKAEEMIREDNEVLCRWGDEGGYCP